MIRVETPADQPPIRAVHMTAFPTAAEANLVDMLRAAGHVRVSLVAEIDGSVVGHVLFSPVTIDCPGLGEPMSSGLGLAPLAVQPPHHRRGIGSALVAAGLEACRASRTSFVVVLGDPAYYTRFGFRPASRAGIGNEYGAGDEFMLFELCDTVAGRPGCVARYAPAFGSLG